MIKRKQNTKTIHDQKETEDKDYKWSKGNITQRLSMIKPFDHWESLCSVSVWSLRVFVFCFLVIIVSIFALCFLLIIESLCVMFQHKDYQWSKGNRTQRLSMIKRKHNTKIINDQKETEHKDYQWSKGNRTQSCFLVIIVSIFALCFLLIIESLCVMFPFDHW
jgi:hypothetical protein